MALNRRLSALIASFTLAWPLIGAAQQAQTRDWVNLRAGPAREYPLILQLPPATYVLVQGCLSDYSWCDVIAPGEARGWVYAGRLLYPYQDTNVMITDYGGLIGLPVIGFSLGLYWGDHYRDRPWFGDRNRWDQWGRQHPHVRPPPPRGEPRGPRPGVPGLMPAPHGPDARPLPQAPHGQPGRPGGPAPNAPETRPMPRTPHVREARPTPQTPHAPDMRPAPQAPRAPEVRPAAPAREAPAGGRGAGRAEPRGEGRSAGEREPAH